MSVGVGVTVEVDGFDHGIEAKIDDEVIAKWIEERLNDGRNKFIREMGRGGGGGHTYRRGRRTHTASAGGEYPVTDSGRLASSTDYEMHGPREGSLGSDVEYAVYLTLGTHKMWPRQMYQEALQEVMDERADYDALVLAVVLETGGPL